MHPFTYLRSQDADQAIASNHGGMTEESHLAVPQYLAGGTTLLDLMKLGTLAPSHVIDIKGLAPSYGSIDLTQTELRLGALVTMATAADHPDIREYFPVIAQSLYLAASPQIRNMATLGGNVLQRTRCNYFRDPSWPACNKRAPGSGCGALQGVNRKHAVLGVSNDCIATYPGDFAQALIALDAKVEIVNVTGKRILPFEDLHVVPGTTPQRETSLQSGDLITGFVIPRHGWLRRSLYLKLRDRESYEFALASAAVALDLDGEIVREVRIGLGGVATKPWRAREAETTLRGRALTRESAHAAAEAAFATALSHGSNDYKGELGRRTLVRALLQAKALEA
jgi:xanthine dehydrogenase YagS FAD-binding subunit